MNSRSILVRLNDACRLALAVSHTRMRFGPIHLIYGEERSIIINGIRIQMGPLIRYVSFSCLFWFNARDGI